MIQCKKHLIAACFTLILPLKVWAEAPVVDESDNFAMVEEQQAYEAPVANPKYDDPIIDSAENNYSQEQDVGPALAKEEPSYQQPKSQLNDSASLIDKIASLQKEVQELRGQLEIQTHDLKVLQQQQLTFYKDLDSRISGSAGKTAQVKPSNDLNVAAKTPAPQAVVPTPQPKPLAANPKPVVVNPKPVAINPAVTTTPN
ncbi:MAG: tol-pal system protein YbgF, partial [Legionella sp.]